MMFSGEPAIHRVPGPWVVFVFGFWVLLGRPNIGSKDLYFVSSFQSVKPFSSQ
jgi:hypothetical protein